MLIVINNYFTFLTVSHLLSVLLRSCKLCNHWWAERDKDGTRVMLTTIAFAMTVDLRSQNRTPGVSLYPVGIAIDSARAVPEGPLLFHDSRKLRVLSHKLRIVFGLRDSHMSCGHSILSYNLVV